MYSTFQTPTSSCLRCNNEILKQLGRLQGVFAATIDRIDGSITVNHTDEISRDVIADILTSLGWETILAEDDPNFCTR
jgi:copper chaperone CopZ